LVSGEGEAASYRATLVNLLLWTLGHIVMAIHIMRSMKAFEDDIKKSLNPEETMRVSAKSSLLFLHVRVRVSNTGAHALLSRICFFFLHVRVRV
jgi:hypothetical protein